jgi:hypothetical protein
LRIAKHQIPASKSINPTNFIDRDISATKRRSWYLYAGACGQNLRPCLNVHQHIGLAAAHFVRDNGEHLWSRTKMPSEGKNKTS